MVLCIGCELTFEADFELEFKFSQYMDRDYTLWKLNKSATLRCFARRRIAELTTPEFEATESGRQGRQTGMLSSSLVLKKDSTDRQNINLHINEQKKENCYYFPWFVYM